MDTNDYKKLLERIETNPKIMVGKPVIRGTRIPVSLVLNLLAHGETAAGIIADYPDLTPDDIQATMVYASALADFETHAYA